MSRPVGRSAVRVSNSVTYQRLVDLDWPQLRKGWPRRLQRIRRVLPQPLPDDGPPPIARHGAWVVAATEGRRTVGFALAVPMVTMESVAYVEEVAVLEQWQRRGIGSELVRGATRWAHELGFDDIAIYPMTSTAWVERLEFRPVDPRTGTWLRSTARPFR